MKKNTIKRYWNRFKYLFFQFFKKEFILANHSDIRDSILIACILLIFSTLINIIVIDSKILDSEIQSKVLTIRILLIALPLLSYLWMRWKFKTLKETFGTFVSILIGFILALHLPLMIFDPGNFFYYLQVSVIILLSTCVILWIEPLRISIIIIIYFIVLIPFSIHISRTLGINNHLLNQNLLNMCILVFIGFVANTMINYWRFEDYRSNQRLAKTLANLKLINSKIQKLSNLDTLTNLYNRRYLLDSFNERILNSQKEDYTFGLIILDLDYLKKINDRYGHIQGDRSILKFSEILLNKLRLGDIAARIGGDEFCILTNKIQVEELFEFAEQIRKDLEKAIIPIYNDSKKYNQVTASVGIILTHGRKNQSFDELYHSIDEALYQAKMEGRNKVILVKS
ncbi:MAG: GGDEF domain-containing protein [Leptospiraceae bacterium]|nr:GGDEF domain-containing protein [Leptospiraceae bacterium]